MPGDHRWNRRLELLLISIRALEPILLDVVYLRVPILPWKLSDHDLDSQSLTQPVLSRIPLGIAIDSDKLWETWSAILKRDLDSNTFRLKISRRAWLKLILKIKSWSQKYHFRQRELIIDHSIRLFCFPPFLFLAASKKQAQDRKWLPAVIFCLLKSK